jgi:glycosyltransferase involved in cell wall biosynthesis
MPNFNKSAYLRYTLESILEQTYQNWECIIVDDHSTDDSWNILEEFSVKDQRFKIYRRPDSLPKGGNVCRNYAFQLSKGEYIQWFDSDDIMPSNFLSAKISVLTSNVNLDFVLCDLRCFSDDVHNASPYKNLDLSQVNIEFPINALLGNFWIQTSVPLFKKKFLSRFQTIFSENLSRGQESEFFNRILFTNPRFQFSPETIVYWRVSDNSITNRFKQSPASLRSRLTLETHMLIAGEFLKNKKLSRQEVEYFNRLFRFHLVSMESFGAEYFKLYWFGLVNGLFLNNVRTSVTLVYHFFRKIWEKLY